MAVTVKIPTPLRGLTQNQDTASVDVGDVTACVAALEGMFPGMRERLVDETGEIRRFVNIYVNGEDVRFLSGAATPLKSGDEVSIVPAVAGGA
jgi:molybdopterin synthase sulfur carrier subunit